MGEATERREFPTPDGPPIVLEGTREFLDQVKFIPLPPEAQAALLLERVVDKADKFWEAECPLCWAGDEHDADCPWPEVLAYMDRHKVVGILEIPQPDGTVMTVEIPRKRPS